MHSTWMLSKMLHNFAQGRCLLIFSRELVLSFQGVVMLNLGCGYVKKGVVMLRLLSVTLVYNTHQNGVVVELPIDMWVVNRHFDTWVINWHLSHQLTLESSIDTWVINRHLSRQCTIELSIVNWVINQHLSCQSTLELSINT